jgi:hypothetical protein
MVPEVEGDGRGFLKVIIAPCEPFLHPEQGE